MQFFDWRRGYLVDCLIRFKQLCECFTDMILIVSRLMLADFPVERL
jgi:hypothetical protein